MAKTLATLADKAKRTEKRSADGGVIQEAGLSHKDIDVLIGLNGALHRLAKQADADDVARFRQLKGMTDEQLEEQERRLKAAQQSEAIKEGLRARSLDDEVGDEDGED